MKWFICLILCVSWLTGFAWAGYYDSGYIEFSQPNNVTFIGREWGDEFFFQRETQSGYQYVKESDGYYYYATLDEDGKYASTDFKVAIDAPPTESYHLQPSSAYKSQVEDARGSVI